MKHSRNRNFPTLFAHVKILSHSLFFVTSEETSKLKPNLWGTLAIENNWCQCPVWHGATSRLRLLAVLPLLCGIVVGNPHEIVGRRETLHSLPSSVTHLAVTTDKIICSQSCLVFFYLLLHYLLVVTPLFLPGFKYINSKK